MTTTRTSRSRDGAATGDRRRHGGVVAADDRGRCGARAGPDAQRRPVRPEPGPALPLASGIGADRGHPDRDQGRRCPGQRDPRIQGGDAHLRRRRRQPDRIWTRRDLRRERPGLLHPKRPDRLHDVAARTGPRLRLGHAQVVPGLSSAPNGCYDAETIALDEFGHVEGLNHHGNYANDSDYLDAVVQTYSRTKPSSGWNMHVFGRCDVALAPAPVRHADLELQVLDLPGPRHQPRPQRIVHGGHPRWLDDVHRDAQGRGSRLVPAARRQPDHGTDRDPPATRRGDVDLGERRDDGGRRGRRHLRDTLSPRSDADYRAVFATPSNEGINGDTSPTVSVLVFSQCEVGRRSPAGVDTPCI